MDTLNLHEVVHYRGRDVCSCGDFNCASLDIRPRPKPILHGTLRNAIAKAYPGENWARRVKAMSDEQVYVIFHRLQNQNKI